MVMQSIDIDTLVFFIRRHDTADRVVAFAYIYVIIIGDSIRYT